MNMINEMISVVGSTDPTKAGRTGRVVLETAKTLVLETRGTTIRVEKFGSVFELTELGVIVAGADIAGRLEDRWGRVRR
jgi:RNase P/RNase MRP subunit p29